MWVGTKISGKCQYRIQSFRCDGCGYLENYAAKKSEVEGPLERGFA